ncbi:MAG TPA: hypothetical protein V6D27_00740 [Vampirovibrionales bacterium]
MKREKYQLLSAVRYNNRRVPAGGIVELSEEEAHRLCRLGAIALSPLKETPPKKPKEDPPEPKVEDPKSVPQKDPVKTKEG